MAFAAGGSSSTGPASSPEALLRHLQTLSQLPAMQDKLQVLSDALSGAPQAQPGSLIDGSNCEGDADSKAWQYDCEVCLPHMDDACCCERRSQAKPNGPCMPAD